MTQASTAGLGAGDIQFRQIAAFAEISDSAEVRLKESIELLRFRIGQPLSEAEALPARVLLLLEGECRLLGKEQGKFATLARMGPGSFVGLASLLRAEACEGVTAVTDLVTAAIPDELIVELYGEEASFAWCDQQLWPAELADSSPSCSAPVPWAMAPFAIVGASCRKPPCSRRHSQTARDPQGSE